MRLYIAIIMLLTLLLDGGCSRNGSNSFEKGTLNILYAADSKFAVPLRVSIASLLSNTKKDVNLNLYIVDLGLSLQDLSRIEALSQIRDFRLEVLKFDDSVVSGINCYYWTPAVYVKCFASKLLEDLDKCLWLDADTVIERDISEMYLNTSLTGCYFAGVTYLPSNLVKSDAHKDGKINGGVLLMNLDKMRKERFPEQVLDVVKHGQAGASLFTEETAITLLGKNKSVILPFRYNIYPRFANFKNELRPHPVYYPYEEVENAVIYHYGGAMRPWTVSCDTWTKKGRSKYIYDAWYRYYKQVAQIEVGEKLR